MAAQIGCGLVGRKLEIYTGAVPYEFTYEHFQ
jgi:hypothetical protein